MKDDFNPERSLNVLAATLAPGAAALEDLLNCPDNCEEKYKNKPQKAFMEHLKEKHPKMVPMFSALQESTLAEMEVVSQTFDQMMGGKQ